MRRTTPSGILLFASLALLLLTAIACQQQQPQQNAATGQQTQPERARERVVGTPGGSLTYRLTSPPQTFNYLMAKEESSIILAFYLMGGRLVEFDQDQQKHIPGLVESWKWADDKKTLEVTLRDGLKFSDGHALTADDVVFTMRALYDERTQSPIFRDTMLVGGKQIETTATDARHLRMTFPETVAAPEGYLSNVAVLPRHALESELTKGTLKDAWSVTSDPKLIVTSGAFMVESITPGERVILKRNPNYWKKDSSGNQLPYLDTLVIEIVADSNNAIARLGQNSIDIVDRIRPSDYAALKNAPEGTVRPYDLGPGMNTDYIWFNLNDGVQNGKPVVDPIKRAWFADARFRRALAHAIERNSIATANLQGLATPLYSFVSPGNRTWAATDLPRPEYDLEKARALLREAGFTVRGSQEAPELVDAKGNRVEFTMIVPVENQPRVDMATVIQQDLQKLGISMQPAPIEFQALTGRWSQSYDYDAVLLGLSVTDPDPSSYTNFLQSASGNHQWYPKQPKPASEWEARLDQLDTEQAHELDPARRRGIFREIQSIMNEQMPIIPIVARHIATAGFTEPVNIENVPNTDQAYGHGTFVAGIIGGSGSKSNGKYGGIAPGARLVGLSAGDLNLSYVLSGFDYLLSKGAGLNVRVVNCSFSANTVFDINDPVNVATKMLTDRGVNIVFSAGNTGSGEHTLNPYAVAPWVVSVGATDESGRLASFSSRGDFGSRLFRPTLVAPGVNLVSTRAAGANVTGTTGVAAGADTKRLSTSELPYYTTASGTSFSAPQVAGTIALMLEVNPNLTPRQVRDILQRSATPLPLYFQHEVGAGMLNSYAAVLESAFPERRMGLFRATLDQGQVTFVNQSVQQFAGSVAAMGDWDAEVNIPADTVLASAQTGWAMTSASDLGLAIYNEAGAKMGEADSQNRSGLTGRSEGVTMRSPAAGQLRVHISQPLGTAAQPVLGLLEVTRVEYAPLTDLGQLSVASRSNVYQALRSFVLSPYGNRFRPGFGVTRAELASALVRSGRVPQYLPAQSRYTDVTDRTTMLFVESAQNAPAGAVFTDAVSGNRFRPEDFATRLTAAVALVRAAGLQSEASTASLPLGLTDAGEIPVALRGYVAVALARGWLTVENNSFRPQSTLTRAELAQAVTK